MEELSKLRDELYEALPTGKIDAFELTQVIKNHISKLDELIELKKLLVGDVSGSVCDNCGEGKPFICAKCYEIESNFRESY